MYQVGYTRSHPNTEVKMLRACSVPLCSHRWERQVTYLFPLFFSFFFTFIPLFPPLYSLSLSSPVLFPPPSPSLIPPVPFMCLFPVLFPEVSWCSRLSHHFYVVRVPGSNPGGTIFMLSSLLSYPILFLSLPFFFLLYPLPAFSSLSLSTPSTLFLFFYR